MARTEISVVIPTWRRTSTLRRTLEVIIDSKPPPGELLVHVDASDAETAPMIRREFGNRVVCFGSSTTQGPGGGRNLLIQRARNNFIASFDDDSWPMIPDYFAVAADLLSNNTKAAVITGQVTLRGERKCKVDQPIREVNCFESGACILRRDAFLKTRKYLPLRFAYGLEEADVALQLLDAGWSILKAPSLAVFHDCDMTHYAGWEINAAHITNTAMLIFLRYPILYWPLGLAQITHRIFYAVRQRRFHGILRGLTSIPIAGVKYAKWRAPVSARTVARSRRLVALGRASSVEPA